MQQRETDTVYRLERKPLRTLTPFQEILVFFTKFLQVHSAHYTRNGIHATIIHKGHVFEVELRDLGPVPKAGA